MPSFRAIGYNFGTKSLPKIRRVNVQNQYQTFESSISSIKELIYDCIEGDISRL